MGGRRRNLFVLLFVGGLIAVSALVIASKQTRLGLDLKGGIQLVLQGRPTPQQPTIDNASMTRAVDTIRNGCDQLGVSEIEVARVGADQIQVGIPGATSVGKATDCATKPARLFFYDWEPNLIGIEHQVGGTPGHHQSGSARQAEQDLDGGGPQSHQHAQSTAGRVGGAADRMGCGAARRPAEAGPELLGLQPGRHLLLLQQGQVPPPD